MMADHAERETCMIPPLRPDTRIPVRPAWHNVCIRRFPTPDPTLNILQRTPEPFLEQVL